MNKWKLEDFLKELEERLWDECGTIYKLGGIGRYNGPNGKELMTALVSLNLSYGIIQISQIITTRLTLMLMLVA